MNTSRPGEQMGINSGACLLYEASELGVNSGVG